MLTRWCCNTKLFFIQKYGYITLGFLKFWLEETSAYLASRIKPEYLKNLKPEKYLKDIFILFNRIVSDCYCGNKRIVNIHLLICAYATAVLVSTKQIVVAMCLSICKSFIVKQMYKGQVICCISEEVNIFKISWFIVVFEL